MTSIFRQKTGKQVIKYQRKMYKSIRLFLTNFKCDNNDTKLRNVHNNIKIQHIYFKS